jgi:predicted small secreted protein
MKLTLRMLVVVLCSLFFLNGCNTVHGFGQDMQDGGQEIKKAANK